jgi:hypothetical protein
VALRSLKPKLSRTRMTGLATDALCRRTAPVRESWRMTLAALVAVAGCCAVLGCASKKPPPDAQNQCPANQPGCQVEVVFTDAGLGERVAHLRGSLSTQQPSLSYMFSAGAGDTLRLRSSGNAVMRVVLVRPTGDSTSPVVPSDTPLSSKGKYVLRVAANTAAENAYGDFDLEMRVIGKP